MVTPYDAAITLLCNIPGVDRASAITIISEIGTDMSQFANPKRLCCWAGLTPSNRAFSVRPLLVNNHTETIFE